MQDSFKLLSGKSLPYPIFFPDATRGFVRELSWEDIEQVKLPGVLVNTFHLLRLHGTKKTEEAGGVRPLIGWPGAIISDSGGFQVMSMVKANGGKVDDDGVLFEMEDKEYHFSPEDSIKYQIAMKTDLCVVLDDFTPPDATYEEAEETVKRTTEWAARCKIVFANECERKGIKENERPYLIGVVQGGEFEDLRLKSIKELMAIGFDGYGYGGFPMKDGKFDEATARLIARELGRHGGRPLLYGLGIGKPDDIVKCYRLGWQIFDCVLPTRDARHGRLYVYKAPSIDEINLNKDFYEYYLPHKQEHLNENVPVSTACDCELCTTLTRAKFATMWRAREKSVLRLASIHNLRFYGLLCEKLREQIEPQQ